MVGAFQSDRRRKVSPEASWPDATAESTRVHRGDESALPQTRAGGYAAPERLNLAALDHAGLSDYNFNHTGQSSQTIKRNKKNLVD
jgi:hypothetical protein